MFFSKATKRRWRYVKTIILAIFATGTLVWGAIVKFDVDPAEIKEFMLLSAGLVGLLIVMGLLAACVVVALKKLRQR
jgi:hypothetical protein